MSAFRRIATVAAMLLVAGVLTTGCGIFASSQPECPAGLHPYKDKCLSQMAMEYVGCTEGRGVNVTTEISGSVGGSFKAVADASLSVAHKKSQQENTPVALQIVKDCLEIAKTSKEAGPEQATLASFQQQVDKSMQEFEERQLGRTATIKINKTTARAGEKVTVQGEQFQANEQVDLLVGPHQVARTTADAKGSFSATITIPKDTMRGMSHSIIATGRTSVRTDSLPIQVP